MTEPRRPPDLDELVGGDIPRDERERLRRAHEALLAAGPPPELPLALRHPPGTPEQREASRWLPQSFPGRRAGAAALAAAALLAVTFGSGYLLGRSGVEDEAFAIDYVLPMRGTPAAPTARASLEVGRKDAAGNWPMRMVVRDLPELPGGQRYELLLTRNGRPAASCGTFRVRGAKTVVFLNAPYRLRAYDGWIVTRAGGTRPLLVPVKDARRGRGRSGEAEPATTAGNDSSGRGRGSGRGGDDTTADNSGPGSSGSGEPGSSGPGSSG